MAASPLAMWNRNRPSGRDRVTTTVRRFHLGDRGEIGLLRVHRIRGAGAVQGELHVGGIGGGAVVEPGIRAQAEAVGQPVFRDGPISTQAGDQLAVAVDAQQQFEQVGVGHFLDGARRPAVGSRCGGSSAMPTTRSVRGWARAAWDAAASASPGGGGQDEALGEAL